MNNSTSPNPYYANARIRQKINSLKKLNIVYLIIMSIDALILFSSIIALSSAFAGNVVGKPISTADVIASPGWIAFSILISIFSIIGTAGFIINIFCIIKTDNIKSDCLDPMLRSDWNSVFLYFILGLFIIFIFNICAQIKINNIVMYSLPETNPYRGH